MILFCDFCFRIMELIYAVFCTKLCDCKAKQKLIHDFDIII